MGTTKLLKVESIKKDSKENSGKSIVSFKNNGTIKKSKKDLNLKIDDYVFCKLKEDGNLYELGWKLYQSFNNYDVYEQWKKSDSKCCHYGLKMDKLSNIFNNRIGEKIPLYNNVNGNIDDYLENDRNCFEDIDFEAKVLDKMVVGLGGQSVFETDITIHHTYGIPYIPASAIKGCLRSNIIQKYFKSDEKLANKEKWFIAIFGGVFEEKTYKGSVIFLDAFPIRTSDIQPDIMTPHYQNGYKDNGKIIPISFLTVKGVYFRFILRIKKNFFLKDESTVEKCNKDFLIKEMFDMLYSHGIGAKTSVGYGYFSEISENDIKKQSEKNNERIIQKIELKKIEYDKKFKKMQEDIIIAKMSTNERLIYEISSKKKEEIQGFLNELLKIMETMNNIDKIEISRAVKTVLLENEMWPGKTEKQKNKVAKIEEYLSLEEA